MIKVHFVSFLSSYHKYGAQLTRTWHLILLLKQKQIQLSILSTLLIQCTAGVVGRICIIANLGVNKLFIPNLSFFIPLHAQDYCTFTSFSSITIAVVFLFSFCNSYANILFFVVVASCEVLSHLA